MSSPTRFDNMICPMPKIDHDVITLGHGSGGLLTYRLLDQFIFKALESETLKNAHDGAILDMEGPLAFTTDSFVVSPVFFPGGNIGDLAVNGTVNDVTMCGAIPQYLSLSFILEEGLKMTDLWTILQSIKIACKKAHVKIVTGDTKVVEQGKGDQIFINTTGIGTLHPKASIDKANIKEDDVVIVSGPIANHGITILSVRDGLTFETNLESDSRALNNLVLPLLDQFGPDIHFLRDPTRGGVASALNEIAQSINMGITIEESDLVLENEVKGACEMLGLDPLYVANEGIFIMIVNKDIAPALLNELKKRPHGNQAAVIGHITLEHKGQVVLNAAIGGRRVVNMLAGDQLPRIC